jgi:hypothetical protein
MLYGRKIILLFSIILSNVIIFAQDVQFHGTWILKQKFSLLGEDYDNGVPSEITIIQSKDSIKMISVNRQPLKISISELRKKVISVHARQRSIVETIKYYVGNKKQFDRFVTYKLKISGKGKTLTLVRSDTDYLTGEVLRMKGEYQRL